MQCSRRSQNLTVTNSRPRYTYWLLLHQPVFSLPTWLLRSASLRSSLAKKAQRFLTIRVLILLSWTRLYNLTILEFQSFRYISKIGSQFPSRLYVQTGQLPRNTYFSWWYYFLWCLLCSDFTFQTMEIQMSRDICGRTKALEIALSTRLWAKTHQVVIICSSKIFPGTC